MTGSITALRASATFRYFTMWKNEMTLTGVPADTVYQSKVRIERIKGPLRRAHLPAEPDPVLFGVHSEVAEHYGVDPDVHEPHTTTLDYVVAAAGG